MFLRSVFHGAFMGFFCTVKNRKGVRDDVKIKEGLIKFDLDPRMLWLLGAGHRDNNALLQI